jgi:hypothetical protein
MVPGPRDAQAGQRYTLSQVCRLQAVPLCEGKRAVQIARQPSYPGLCSSAPLIAFRIQPFRNIRVQHGLAICPGQVVVQPKSGTDGHFSAP